jgi:exodeoxyribonuclease V gamma subunit
VWPLLEVIEAALDEPWATSLARHLGHGGEEAERYRENRRLGTARHLAALLYRYALHRPELVGGWTRGEGPAAGAASSAGWQAELWRRLRARIGPPDPAERLAAACETLRARPDLVALPERVSLFGLTRLPASYLSVLRALASGRDLHIFLLHPSPVLWESVRDAPAGAAASRSRADDATAERVSHPLLRSWGRDVRELQLVLGEVPGAADHHLAAEPTAPSTLLGRIQEDIRHDRAPAGSPLPGRADERGVLAPDDSSVAVHSCHGHARQVEVLREAILHALARDETLEPRDVLVMCPDIETYAPLIQAVFGAAPGDEEPDAPGRPGDETRALNLRVRLADRSLRQTNPVLGVVAALLELAGGRVSASQVLDLADREPVRRRFRLADDDLGRIQDWIADAGIRWGLDAEHRAPFKLAAVDSGTWAAGLDRLLLGVTMTEDEQRLYADVLPLDDVDSGAIDLAGRLDELLSRLRAALDSLATPQPLAAWARALTAAADALTRTSPRDSWQRAQLGRILDELAAQAGASDARLRLAEVRALLAERLQGRPTRANFRTGHLTICTLVPMRSVPHRVVCLLGLDDGAFPRKPPRDGDDVMLEQPQLGERDPRSEDRQLLLDALMAAGEQLIITHSGHDERTNTPLPPAVPVGELLDAVDATVRLPGDAPEPARTQVVTEHPLQPFDPRNFTPGTLRETGAWSFDPVALHGAEAIVAPRHGRRPFLTSALPPTGERAHELEDLVRFVGHPVRAFLRNRLSISLFERSDSVEDEMRAELDGLERWEIGQALLEALLAGVDGRTACLAQIRRGVLPPGDLGRPVLSRIYGDAQAIAAASVALVDGPREPVDLHLELPGGRTLTGTVPGVAGGTLLASTYSRLAPRHRIVTWVRLLALTLADPATPYRAATVGRGGPSGVAVAHIRPLAGEAVTRRALAAEQLLALLDLFDRGMREPLPIFCKSSAAYAAAVADGRDGADAARAEWETTWGYDREDREAEHQLVLGGVLPLAELLAAAPAEGEHGPGWDPSETSRFGRLACRLWDGLLEHEELV